MYNKCSNANDVLFLKIEVGQNNITKKTFFLAFPTLLPQLSVFLSIHSGRGSIFNKL